MPDTVPMSPPDDCDYVRLYIKDRYYDVRDGGSYHTRTNTVQLWWPGGGKPRTGSKYGTLSSGACYAELNNDPRHFMAEPWDSRGADTARGAEATVSFGGGFFRGR
jgi:hypothetical protein